MRKLDLAHILRTSAAILDEREFVVIGSQSIWGTTDQPLPNGIRLGPDAEGAGHRAKHSSAVRVGTSPALTPDRYGSNQPLPLSSHQ